MMSETITKEQYEQLIQRVQQVEQSKADCIEAIETCLRSVFPREGQYSRGLYNGLLTAIAIMTGKDQDHRLCKDDPVIVIAQGMPTSQ